MNFKKFLNLPNIFVSLFVLTAGTSIPSLANTEYVYPDEFVCRKLDGVFSTFAVRDRSEFSIIRWTSTEWREYSQEDRCMVVSARLTQAAQDRSLRYLTHGWMNEQPVVCTSSREAGQCDRLIFTLLHREASMAPVILRNFNDVGGGRSSGPIYRGWGSPPEIVTETIDGQVSVNMEALFSNLFDEE